MILAGCVPELGQRCADDGDCPATDRCDPPGWCVPRQGGQPADARGGDAMDVVDAGLDATLDVGADGDVEADASQDADLVDVYVPDAVVGCGEWIDEGGECHPPQPACAEGEQALARGCLPAAPECAPGWMPTEAGCIPAVAVGCSEKDVTAGPEGCLPEVACPEGWLGQPCRRVIPECGPGLTPGLDGACRPIRPACQEIDIDPDLGERPIWVVPGPPGADMTGVGTQVDPYHGVNTALASEPEATSIILEPGIYMERLDLRRQSIYLRGPCGEMPAEIAGGIDVSQDARLAHVTVRANRIDPAVISHTAGTLTLHDVRIVSGMVGLAVTGNDATVVGSDVQLESAGDLAFSVAEGRVQLERLRLLGANGNPVLGATDATLELSDLYATGGLILDGVEGTIADALIYPGQPAALRLSGASAGLEFSRITVRTPPDAVQPQPAILNDGVAFHLEGLDVEGRGALDMDRGDARMEQVAVTSPSLVIQISGGGYALIADASLASAGSIADVVAGHLGLTAARLSALGPDPVIQVRGRASLGLRNVRIEDFPTVALRILGPKPGDDPQLTAHGLRLRGGERATRGITLTDDASALLEYLDVDGVSDAALHVNGGTVELSEAWLRHGAAGDLPTGALDLPRGDVAGTAIRLEGPTGLRLAGGSVTLDHVTAFGSRQGIAVTAGTARITDARVRGRIGASALGPDALLSLTRAYVNDDAEGDRLALAAGDGARLSLQGAAVRGTAEAQAALYVEGGATAEASDLLIRANTGLGIALNGGRLTGRDLDVAAPGTCLVALGDAAATAAYLVTRGAVGILHQGPAPAIAPHLHIGPADGRTVACADDCPIPPDLR
ncbi:MAG: hypothetical protein R3F60_12450 [bacterium]